MGIWTDAFIAPVEPVQLPVEVFGRMVVDLARERVVRTPWALLAGDLCVNASLNWESVSGQARWDRPEAGAVLRSEKTQAELRGALPPPWGESWEQARLLAGGEAILQVLPALAQAPYGHQDIAVVFDCLDFTNRSVSGHFGYEDHRTMLVCFALARPQNRPLAADTTASPSGPVHPVRSCIVHTFKHCDEDGIAPAIASIASRYFGRPLVHGETWG
ncbi:hypothetical protein TR631_38090 [Streptomyces rochei]|uniref:hypothetical protein n=2 Tax=Streptomyces TaxID=1883 RepID=UPI002812201D|nr:MULTISPECIES: hypothetical protein [Streptomyces]WQC10345.1 hypothetical protein TR631_00220 [Streptomyces rochei]WQC17330.1 hypothetical protein TR631_38090 [Streptomyces rochei]